MLQDLIVEYFKHKDAMFNHTTVELDEQLHRLTSFHVAEQTLRRASQQAVDTDAQALCRACTDIGRNGEHSYFCIKCSAPLC